jgi:LacI family transcriptional regulator/LacI family repressor for deo operon, udp, cdd, tsx, nupC, and nupG
LIVRHDLSPEGAKWAALKLLSLLKPPDAVFTVNDPAAIELIILARQKGIAVPQELGVVGFSNDARSEIISPGLTTLAHPINDLAKTAVGLLLKRLDEVSHPKKQKLVTTLKTSLIVRESSVRNIDRALPS